MKTGEIVGLHSFMTDQMRLNSVISKDFCSMYEIKKEDFMKIIKMTTDDYVFHDLTLIYHKIIFNLGKFLQNKR